MTAIDLRMALAPLFVGIFATAMLDVWAYTLNRLLGTPATNWARVGRWVGGLAGGLHRARPIAAGSPVRFELALGWFTHYLVGVVYAFAYLGLMGAMSLAPDAASAVLFGIVTVLAPWLILQPGLGMGYFASGAPRPNLTRALNVVSHTVFGLGLYAGWNLL